ncbi:hypothetical protein DM793_03100 [Paenarthrobacter nitroguajacolicus]|uniref:nuclear transport factor 2 family protein n=1 Tax=Paenarthrobacter nitroguajacolicus TaxID=211146 RepID=UPI0015C0DFF0|nr:nuclear transport factor 2 family protein [Paenarthrobacter nitroguajacolicus]NWL10291.1 hypothetical protein [Paenarthrobacter nitroguajacolicus]
MTSTAEDMLEVVRKYEDYYNTDMQRCIREVYAADCNVHGVDIGGHRHMAGTQQFLDSEARIQQLSPNRTIKVLRTRVAEDIVIVDGVVTSDDRPGWSLPYRSLLTIKDGQIVEDWTFADYKAGWPELRPENHPVNTEL